MPTDSWMQYGSFGLLAVIVIAALWRGLPYFLDKHEKVISTIMTEHKEEVAGMMKEFKDENIQCREERLSNAASWASERAKMYELIQSVQSQFQQKALPPHLPPQTGAS